MSKTFLGKTGNFGADDIVDIIFQSPACASYFASKLYKYFVNEDTDNDKVEMLANRFYQSGYNIQKLLEDIYTSDWFYDKKNIGNKIKSPVELLVGIRRLLPMEIENEEVQWAAGLL